MPTSYRYRLILAMFLTCSLLAACAPQPALAIGANLPLAAITDAQNGVAVSVSLARTGAGSFLLRATFTPPPGYHLYSKDIPRSGVHGQGRPTLLELPTGAKMQPAGPLAESVGASLPGYNPEGPPVYPDGPVTLTLPVQLPEQSGWVADQISLTYMVCTPLNCREPTVGKLIAVQVPGRLSLQP